MELELEESISFNKVKDGFKMDCVKVKDGIVTCKKKKWCNPQVKFYVCEASVVLIQRLIQLRHIEAELDFLTFDISGDVYIIKLSPKWFMLKIDEEEFDALEIYAEIYSDKMSSIISCTHFTKMGFSLLREQPGYETKLLHLTVLGKQKISNVESTSPQQYDLSSVMSLVSKLTPKALHAIEPNILWSSMEDEKFDVISDKNETIGTLTLTFENVHYNEQHCILAEMRSEINTSSFSITVIQNDLLLPNLHILKHCHIHCFKTNSMTVRKQLSLEKKDDAFLIKQVLMHDEDQQIVSKSTLCHDGGGFISELSCLLFQKMLVKKNIQGSYHFFTIDVNQNICNVTVKTLDKVYQKIGGVERKVCKTKVNITPFRRCCDSWNYSFDQNGILLLCEPIGSTISLMNTTFFSLDEFFPVYTKFLEQFQFLSSIAPKDFDSLNHIEYAHVLYQGYAHIGNYVAFIDSIHYKGCHCISVFMASSVQAAQHSCSTTVWAILSTNLEVLQYILHEYVDHKDMKTVISLENGSYRIQTLCMDREDRFKKEISIPFDKCPVLCCEAVGIVIVNLLCKKRVTQSMEFIGVDNKGDLCQVLYESLGFQMMEIYGKQTRAWKVCSRTILSDSSAVLWDFLLAEDGSLLSRQQNGIPLTIVITENSCKI